MDETKRPNRLRDPSKLAELVANIASGKTSGQLTTEDGRDLAAVLLGRRGGLKGGKARAATLSPERRKEIAIRAAQKRWKKADE